MPERKGILRVLTALVAAPVVIGLAYVGGWAFGGLVLAIALAAQWELYAMAEAEGLHPRKSVGGMLGALVGLHMLVPGTVTAALLGALLLILASPFLFERDHLLASLATTLFGGVYPTAFLTFLIRIREARGSSVSDLQAFTLVLTTLLLVWATDIFAYYVGKTWGRHRLAPAISPNKTWEGSVGGAGGALLVAAGLKLSGLGFLAWPHVAVLVVICGGVSQLGDLAESYLKRATGVKDSSTLLPGHGGVLDRFDAMTVAAPLVYLYLQYGAGLYG